MNARMWRPETLHEVSRRDAAGEQRFDPAVREFLDEFYLHPDRREQALAERPIPLSPLKDACLSAVAEHLARSYDLAVPPWSEDHGNGLTRPFFAGGLESLKAILTDWPNITHRGRPVLEVQEAEFIRNFDRYRKIAEREPMKVMRHGRATGYFVSAVEFEELQHLRAYARRSRATLDLTREEIEEMAAGCMAPEHGHLNALMDDE